MNDVGIKFSDHEKITDFKNTGLPLEKRAFDLVSRMTLPEKISQMLNDAPAIPRLGIPAYNWWNECLHGVARAGVATVFPQAIGLAAAFHPELVYKIAQVISDEARAKHHEFARRGDRGIYKGLTFWSPNINIFRDPRWGRGQETYGEDPYLTGRLGVAFVKGLQGDDPGYLKVVATPKHFAVHSGPEKERHEFDVRVSQKDLRETYLPAFKECIREGGAASVMGAYNRVNGEPCCASPTLLQKILREEWGFDGYVVSDCGAICDISDHHRVAASKVEAAALAVNNGCELNCGTAYQNLLTAVEAGLISESVIDRAITRLYKARFRLGMFDPEEGNPYTRIPYEINDSPEHRRLTLEAAMESMVLLKNYNKLLPLAKSIKSIAVIGPNADDLDILLGNYNGTPSSHVTLHEGVRNKVSNDTRVFYAKGCELVGDSREGFAEACAAAERAEVSIICLGLSPKIEGEEGDAYNSDASGDKTHLDLPGVQQQLLEAVYAIGKPVVLVLASGSPLAVNWADKHVPAIIQTWYPGAEGGTALADVLFGDYSPAGRLPVTFVKSIEDLPPFGEYGMKGRTYRYLENEPLYPFGFGLSYTTFTYRNLELGSHEIKSGENIRLTVELENTGGVAGDEVVQIYIKDADASVCVPNFQLCGIQRLHLQPGSTKRLSFIITARQMALINNDGDCILEPGWFTVYVGGSQPDSRSFQLMGQAPLAASFEVTGETIKLKY